MKNVLLLLPGAFSGYGGIEMYNRLLVRAFLELGQERGFAVRTLILNDGTEEVDDRYVPRGAESPRGFRRRKAAFATEAVRRVLIDHPDLVVIGHVHFARLARLVGALAPASRIWFVVYGIEVWHPLSLSIRRGLGRAECVLSISDYSRKELSKNAGVPPERIELLPCALDPVWQEQYAPRPDDAAQTNDHPTLLTVARLAASERYKGVDSVLRALPEVLQAFPNVLYDMVGDGDDRPRLEALARELGVSERVRFRGRLSSGDLAAAYRDCTLFVMPSSHEGFGIVFLEAALFGKASIGGRHGGTPEVIEDGVTGFLVEREDFRGLARVLKGILTDASERGQIGFAARAQLEAKFVYSCFARRVGNLVELNRKPAA